MTDEVLQEFQIAPGFFTEATDRTATARWKHGNRVRFQNGLPEQIGGWGTSDIDLAVTEGLVRNMRSWGMLDSEPRTILGTNLGIYVIEGATVETRTPTRTRDNGDIWATSAFGGSDTVLSNPFTATSGSDVVQITHTAHEASFGDLVEFSGVTGAHGISSGAMNYTHRIIKIVDTNTYQIQVEDTATSTGSGWGDASVDYRYEMTSGPSNARVALGWGIGAWNQDRDGGWNTAFSGDATENSYLIPVRTWSFVQWGEDIIFAPRGGELYYYDADASAVAVRITDAPSETEALVLSQSSQQVFMLGSVPYGLSVYDPMNVRWSDSRNYTAWDPTAINSAGGFRLDAGTRIITGLLTGPNILVWTDEALYRIFQAPATLFYGRQLVGFTEIAGPNAVVTQQGVSYWMGFYNFYIYDGGAIRVLPCDVHERVFTDLNRTQLDKVAAGLNLGFTEIWWHYPSSSSAENDRYVIFNWQDGIWYYGELERTAWRDAEYTFEVPYAIGPTVDYSSSVLYKHETGSTDDGVSMGDFVCSYDFDVRLLGKQDTGEVYRVDRIVPDYARMAGGVDLTMTGKKWPQEAGYSKGPFYIDESTRQVRTRMRARQISLRMDGIGGSWRMGHWRIGGKPDGYR